MHERMLVVERKQMLNDKSEKMQLESYSDRDNIAEHNDSSRIISYTAATATTTTTATMTTTATTTTRRQQ